MQDNIRDQVNQDRIKGRLFKTIWQAAQIPRKAIIILILAGLGDLFFATMMPLLIRHVVNKIIVPGFSEHILFTFLLMMILPVCIAVTSFFFLYYTGYIETIFAYNLRQRIIDHLHKLHIAYFDRVSPGYILARTISDVLILSETVCWGFYDFIYTFGYIIFCIAVIFTLGWQWGLLVTTSSFIVVWFSFYIRKRVLPLQRESRKINSEITSSFSEAVNGSLSFKTLNRGELNCEEFSSLAQLLQKKIVAAEWLTTLIMPVGLSAGYLVSTYVLYQAGKLPATYTELGTIYAVFLYANSIAWPLGFLSEFTRSAQVIQTNSERLVDLLTEPVTIGDSPEVLARYGKRDGEGQEAWPVMRGEVEFSQIAFSYVEDEPVLRDFNLQVPAGSTIAIVGETGAGKSTLVNLLCRFYEPQSGVISIDGYDLRSLPLNWLYSQLSYVLQNPFLFAGTVADNISYAKPEATREEIVSVAKSVYAHDFISKLEHGYDTEVGEGGNRLSTGEKQLISFARALLADPVILILDEATSSIDTETERRIQQAIDRIVANRTSFVIAHRLSTIKGADLILVIEDGTIIESGKHRELLQKKGAYYNLYQNQFVKMEL